ncbi:MAG: hypothetical protein MR299_00080 [Bacteroidales bacterium]|nr:hypothetical protein [Bacteroidales bacterium]
MQGERRSQVYLDYAERSRIFVQASAIFVQASAIELAHIAERSRKCQEIELAHIAERSRKSQRKMSRKGALLRR